MTYDEFMKKVSETAENVGDTVGKAANSAIRKGGEIYERTKLGVRIYTLEQERDAEYARIGRMIYEGRKGCEIREDELEKCYTRMDEILGEISGLKKKADRLRNTKVCAKCGKAVAKDYGYCPICGEKF